MTAFSRAMAYMSALLMSGGATPFRPSKHRGAVTTKLAGKKSKVRLTISRGPGSISAKSDIQQLCNKGQYLEAREMAKEHEHQCGESLFPGAWWRSDETPADNC